MLIAPSLEWRYLRHCIRIDELKGNYVKKIEGTIWGWGVLGELNEAMNTYDALGGFDPADVDVTGAIIDTHAEVKTLPQKHTNLWDVFKEVANKRDNEAMEQHLAPEDKRR